MTRIAFYASVLLSAASLAWGFAPLPALANWLLALCAVWIVSPSLYWSWFSTPALILIVIAAAFGLWLRLPPGWMFAGGIFALTAWDMNDLQRRLRVTAKTKETREAEKIHIFKTSMVAAAGLAFGSITMLLRQMFTSDWGIFLALSAAIMLTQLIGWIRKTE